MNVRQVSDTRFGAPSVKRQRVPAEAANLGVYASRSQDEFIERCRKAVGVSLCAQARAAVTIRTGGGGDGNAPVPSAITLTTSTLKGRLPTVKLAEEGSHTAAAMVETTMPTTSMKGMEGVMRVDSAIVLPAPYASAQDLASNGF